MKQNTIEKLKLMLLKRAFHNSRTQARLRGHDWTIRQDDFIDMWGDDDKWQHRGTASGDLTFCRIDMSIGWHVDNVDIITRHEMLQREAEYKRQKIRSQKNADWIHSTSKKPKR